MKLYSLVDKLINEKTLKFNDFLFLLQNREKLYDYISKKARIIAEQNFNKKIYIRGLIEISNYCKNNCYYCGIRRDNTKIERYRLTKEEILSCCKNGYALGFRTFVLQGGEDFYFSDKIMENIIAEIRKSFPDSAITLSIGEKSYETYLKFFKAGANRYLLRHETANEAHYKILHPKEMSLANKKNCLYNLKKIGYQVGTGFMVGSPYQTLENIAEDLIFINDLKPEMIGIGPFIPHKDTKFFNFSKQNLELTLFLISVFRLMFPKALIPATTAVGTLDANGREKAILCGANVLMPNLSPINVRKKYELYDNKICTGEEAAECISCLKKRLKNIGYEIIIDRGDFLK